MLFFVASFLLFVLLAFQPLPSWASEMRLLSVLLFQEFMFASVQLLKSYSLIVATTILRFPSRMSLRRKLVSKLENFEKPKALSVLDLPELVLENILGRLSPAGLCNMGAVCSSMRDRCRSDHLWERHMREKWYGVIGEAARQEWQSYIASKKDSSCCVSSEGKTKEWIGSLSCVWPLSWLRSTLDSGSKPTNSLPVDSIMSWYLALETGRFWFPAQIYNRENGHVGFMLSSYDAELSYDSKTDTFHARYPPHGRHAIMLEEGVQWKRLRVPPLDTTGHNLHTSDCFTDLCPGNHIEIQWRRNKEFPYGWWYGVVDHLESCDGNELHCRCRNSETVVLEFKQYALGSRWRRASINRKDHREEGNETDGFYGGIRKLQNKEEISMWRWFWPMEILE